MTKITMVNGDDNHLTFNLQYDDNGTPTDLPLPAGSGAKFTVKKEKNDTTALFEKVSLALGGADAECLLTDPGEIEVWILPADTLALEEGIYYYDLETIISSLKKTVAIDAFVIKKGLS